MKAVVVICWFLVLLGCFLGVWILISGLPSATGAPQEAVIICLSLAFVIIPYCFARAMSELYVLEATKPVKEKETKSNSYNYESLNITGRDQVAEKQK